MHSLMKQTLFCTFVLFQLFFPINAHIQGKASSPFRAVPYFMPLQNDPQPIDEIMRESGIKDFIFAFVLSSDEYKCKPAWDGNATQSIEDDTQVAKLIEEVRSSGGDVSVSFGGQTGFELAQACPIIQQLAEAYQSVIDKYELTHIDFDIQGKALDSVDEQIRRFEAIKILKNTANAKGKSLTVSMTLPIDSNGISKPVIAELQRAVSANCKIDFYQIMAFDFGTSMPDEVNNIKDVMENGHEQLRDLRGDLNDEEVYSATGMVLMNGHTDSNTELFTQLVFSQMLGYAKEHNLGRVSFWSLNRDRECTTSVDWVSGFCSSISQDPYEFSKIISDYGH